MLLREEWYAIAGSLVCYCGKFGMLGRLKQTHKNDIWGNGFETDTPFCGGKNGMLPPLSF